MPARVNNAARMPTPATRVSSTPAALVPTVWLASLNFVVSSPPWVAAPADAALATGALPEAGTVVPSAATVVPVSVVAVPSTVGVAVVAPVAVVEPVDDELLPPPEPDEDDEEPLPEDELEELRLVEEPLVDEPPVEEEELLLVELFVVPELLVV